MGSPSCGAICCAIFIPPLGVWLHARGEICNVHVCLNLCLWIFFIFPGMIHALWFIFSHDPDCHSHHSTIVVTSPQPQVYHQPVAQPVYQVYQPPPTPVYAQAPTHCVVVSH